MKLIPKNGNGENINQLFLPTLMVQHFFDVLTAQLAVIFDVKKSPDNTFYPHFFPKNTTEIANLQQDFLWEKHCYELFLAFDNQPNSPYLEINFAPTGEFNLYHFDSYRTPAQMPPRRLQVNDNDRQQLINCYNVRHDWHTVFWQDSLPAHRVVRDLAETKFPLATDSQRLGMIINVDILAKLLKVEKLDEIWLNPCVVFKGEQELAYFANQHASPPDFHDKQYWIKSE